ncbi:anhydro-N-acetylmuramic acid kinase [Thiomicrorhabdus sp. zzn3]|uniref:anhydro-N-acetylmuramic acid kinase n=1 Tax=Thiomicrorhabdus sp. zzn3 TaxID=3039775 RepID=UPI002436CCC9|nr:anhydro-N-acetylmuramic acid kinase [Thiomicrorhabdus sp. zzn3]MDG6779145.1 anhydro-N-acetylmuramic acid kinase [Thiomicrorhabdus sp. zzn3]
MATASKAPSPEYYIGLMSGTSVDGVDAALVKIENTSIELIDSLEHPLDETLKAGLIELNQTPEIPLARLCQLEFKVAQAFSDAALTLLKKTGYKSSQIRAIGSHGQTIYHAPNIPMSLQIGHPAFIAKQTGIDTVADFRIDNMAAGGQGAPLAPAFHKILFAQQRPAFVVNIGGIANISYLDPVSGSAIGFDCGPGNALMDELCQTTFDCRYDRDGHIAAQGKVIDPLLKQLLSHPYFQQAYPKSTGRETFHSAWLQQQLHHYGEPVEPKDLMATLCELTAASIALGILQILTKEKPDTHNRAKQVWIVGGGAYNPHLLNRLQKQLTDFEVASSDKINIHPNALEAMMCAWLAQQRVQNSPIDLIDITGANRNVVLGGLWLAD